jgi:hypothetical protein
MKEFRKPGKVDGEAVTLSKKNSEGEFVFFTGTPKTNNRKASGRTAVLSLVKEKRKPIPLAVLYERARAAAGDKGFDPAFARGGLSLAGLAKPAVYFLLYKDEKGNYRAGVNIPNPDENFSKRPFKKGDIVIAAAKAEADVPALPAPGGSN